MNASAVKSTIGFSRTTYNRLQPPNLQSKIYNKALAAKSIHLCRNSSFDYTYFRRSPDGRPTVARRSPDGRTTKSRRQADNNVYFLCTIRIGTQLPTFRPWTKKLSFFSTNGTFYLHICKKSSTFAAENVK